MNDSEDVVIHQEASRGCLASFLMPKCAISMVGACIRPRASAVAPVTDYTKCCFDIEVAILSKSELHWPANGAIKSLN